MNSKKIYTIRKSGNQHHYYVVSKRKILDKLAIVYGDFDVVGGWCGITSANYKKAESMLRKISKPNSMGLLIDNGDSYRVFQSKEDFENLMKHYNYDWSLLLD